MIPGDLLKKHTQYLSFKIVCGEKQTSLFTFIVFSSAPDYGNQDLHIFLQALMRSLHLFEKLQAWLKSVWVEVQE